MAAGGGRADDGLMVGPVRRVAGGMLRRGWCTCLLIAVLAGLLSGVVVWAWAAGRRGSTAVDRFLEATGGPDVGLGFCRPGATTEDIDADPSLCEYEPTDELQTLRAAPEVEAASR